MGSLYGDAYRQEGFKTIAGLARSRTMRTPVNAYMAPHRFRVHAKHRTGCETPLFA